MIAAGQGASALINLLPIVAIFAVFYFIVILPHKKQQQRKQKLIAELKKGDRVITNGGIYGTVAAVEENALMLKVSENTKIRVAKSAIAGPVSGDGTVPE
jgi:preprotein translocase subunit YajC